MAAGLLVSIPTTELAFRWQGYTTSRPPKTITLTIPAGTSAEVGQGKSTLPPSLSFVAGDTLVIKNEDSVLHTLGPLVIPAGSTASLALTHTGNLSYTCSFQPSKYLGLDILEPLTLGLRMEGIIIAGFPLGILITLYSLILRPLKKGHPFSTA